MLIPLQPSSCVLPGPAAVPAWLLELVDPGLSNSSLPAVVSRVIGHLGFTTMLYGMAKTVHRSENEKFYFWTTVPAAWVAEYDAKSYVEVDPRIAFGWDSPPPLIWDRSIAGDDMRVGRFLERASRFGIGSGLALYFAEEGHSVLVSLNRSRTILSARDREQIQEQVGDALHFAYVFHWMFMRRIVAVGVPPIQEGAPLSPREIQCLRHAAHGMTSAEMGLKLGITERTANFHFSNIISKLGVLNRKEAIAMAVAREIIQIERLGDANRSLYFAKRVRRRPKVSPL
jgi:DNA-binding CsgD family transcriptional regulator